MVGGGACCTACGGCGPDRGVRQLGAHSGSKLIVRTHLAENKLVAVVGRKPGRT